MQCFRRRPCAFGGDLGRGAACSFVGLGRWGRGPRLAQPQNGPPQTIWDRVSRFHKCGVLASSASTSFSAERLDLDSEGLACDSGNDRDECRGGHFPFPSRLSPPSPFGGLQGVQGSPRAVTSPSSVDHLTCDARDPLHIIRSAYSWANPCTTMRQFDEQLGVHTQGASLVIRPLCRCR
jgi:hypothetical protein